MTHTAIIEKRSRATLLTQHAWALRALATGTVATLGFAPFHLPGLLILSLALLFAQLSSSQNSKRSFKMGFLYGMGFFGTGVTWIYVSMQQFGHLHPLLATSITLLFVLYLACFTGLSTLLYTQLKPKYCNTLFACTLFSTLWCLTEYLRATCLGGFPWLQVGFSQMDTPLRYLLPLIGIYGVGFLVLFAASLLCSSLRAPKPQYAWIVCFVAIMLLPELLKHRQWTKINDQQPMSVAVIQANLSMRDKWDESLFWQLLNYYQQKIDHFVGKKQIIVLPESAIPLPAQYISDILNDLDLRAKSQNTAILLGIPYPISDDEPESYYNTLSGFGRSEGRYEKQQLVPFGEYIPKALIHLVQWLSVPMNNLKPGQQQQTLMKVNQYPMATLICYELAYPPILRKQMPQAQWIVSISDDGWFGRSLALYQHLQMAQVLSILTGRYQIVANNDGLSSVINDHGDIVHALPAFKEDVLEDVIYRAQGSTPWIWLGDMPVLWGCLVFAVIAWRLKMHKRSNK